MRAKREDIAKAVLKILDESQDSKRAAQAIASYLIAERRTGELDSLLRDLEAHRFDEDGVLEVHATSAFPLSEEVKRQIEELFEAREVVIHEEQNKALLGGVKVRALDKVADFSVQTRLQRLRQGGKA